MSDDTQRPNDGPQPTDDDATIFRNDATVLRPATLSVSQSKSESSWQSSASSDGDADAPRVLKQRFVLEDKIGSGGMGTVFRAKDLRKVEARDSQPHVAVKVLNNDFRRHPEAFIALEREASKSQSLRHNNIVSIFDFDKDGDVPFITMELLEGEELADRLRAYPNGLPADLAWSVIHDMVAGLGHAHAEGVVHADFKPGNVFVTHEGATKVLDFGIARAVRSNHAGEDTNFDPARLAALTPAYASREMLNGDNPEPRDDLYSLGVVMYMVLSGRHPFGRLPATDAANEGLKPERPKGVSWRQWRVIQQCLSFNRQGRPADASVVMEMLFGRPAWQRWSAVASLAIAVAGGIFAVTYEPADITEVKQEVRQETLVGAQIERIEALLSAPRFDQEWPRQMLVELDMLRHLDFMHAANQDLQARTEMVFADFVLRAPNLAEASQVYEQVQDFGELGEVEAAFRDKLATSVTELQEQPIDTNWLKAATDLLATMDQYFPSDQLLHEQRSDLAARVQHELPQLLAQKTEVASQAWDLVEADVANADERQEIDNQVAEAVQASAAAKAEARILAERKRVLASLDRVLRVSCLRISAQKIADQIGHMPQVHQAAARERAHSRIDDCYERLAVLDVAEANGLEQSRVKFLGQPQDEKRLDPCAASTGVCSDALIAERGANQQENKKGPKLVVVAADAMPFAISKYEISWREFSVFCQATAQCETAGEQNLPVTNVHIDLIEAYADWLSQQTGFSYRLPTLAEWQVVAEGEPDPNRNCRVEVAGLKRGAVPVAVDLGADNTFGLVHVFGNARELVRHEQDYISVGGGFDDPITQCDSAAQTTAQVDVQTGFRLVREVS